MALVFVSFLGVGGLGGYDPVVYTYRGRALGETRFVQRALVEAYGPAAFDRVLFLVTASSLERSWPPLRDELDALGLDPGRVTIAPVSENLAREAEHWAWFERVLAFLDPGDSLVLDLTHGFRIVPIVLSAAVGYLQAAKGVRLEAVLYGADKAAGVIVDVKGFYRVNAWADAVSRLVEKADADKLAELAEGDEGGQFPNLRDPALVRALRDLTGILTNIEVHAVADRARAALALLRERMERATGAEHQMLSLVADKFVGLVSGEPPDGHYSRAYLEVQLEVARLLLAHGLNMQAFTVLRELVGSIGMLGLVGTKYHKRAATSDGRKLRGRFAETFVAMVNYDQNTWTFAEQRRSDADTLLPWYERLAERGVLDALCAASRDLVKIRNGFDHAWTGVSPPDDSAALRRRGEDVLLRMRAVVEGVEAI